MPRYHSLENYYATTYLYENDASMQQQGAPQPPTNNGNPNPQETGPQVDDYNLRRAILKLQEWVMYIDEKFADTVDEMGGLKEFFSIMVDKMAEDEMIRPQQGNFEDDGTEEYEQGDEDIEDTDVEYEMQNNENQSQQPQSFQNINRKG